MSGITSATLAKEVIHLYREVFRKTRIFDKVMHPQEGVAMGKLMRESVRKEFHQAQQVTSTEEITRLLAVGRGCLLRVEDQLVSKDVVTEEERTLAQHARDGTEPTPVAPGAEGDADLNSFVIKDERT